jgi:prepilin-type processing-associated H-X9-DG protein/prepilin-type N-terminal cleavage/methylation domain-containing protein
MRCRFDMRALGQFRISDCGLRLEVRQSEIRNPGYPLGAAIRNRRMLTGMTLVELLVVVAIIGLLVALLLPAVQAAREAARRSECQSNLRQLGVAMALHANAHRAFPVGCLGYRGDFTVTPPAPARFIAWNVPLLPYVDEQAVADSINTSLPSYHSVNKPAAATIVEIFLCPSTVVDPRRVDDPMRQTKGLWKGAAFTDFAGIYGVEGPTRQQTDAAAIQTLADNSLGALVYEEAIAPKQIVDGLSKTCALAETTVRRETESEWINGQNIFAQDESTPINHRRAAGNEVGSPHPGGASLAFCDGHVEFVAETIAQVSLNALLTRAGGE